MEKQEIYESLERSYFSEEMDEKEVIEHLWELLRPAKLFVDIGASLGQYTYFANRTMARGEIVAIEADPIRYERLESNCRTWNASSSNTIRSIHGAASDKDGKITFHTTSSNVSGGLFSSDTV